MSASTNANWYTLMNYMVLSPVQFRCKIPQNLLRKIFLIWEICSQIKKISESFPQNKKNKLTKKN